MVGPLPVKFIIIGEAGVGKTCLMKRFSKGEFNKYEKSTLQPDLSVVYVQVQGFHVQLDIYDTLGQERYGNLPNIYYRNIDGIILACDLTASETFSRLTSWLEEIKGHCGDDVPVVIAGNKRDDTKKRAVTQFMIRQFAEEKHYQFVETSAKDDINVQLVFFSLLKEVLQKKNLLPEGYDTEMRVIPKEAITGQEPHLPQKLPAEKVDVISLKLHRFKESTGKKVTSTGAQTGEDSQSCSC